MIREATGIVSSEGGGTKTLVVIFLRGGADGLTMVPPIGDRDYYAARPTLAVKESDILALGETHYGLHPSMEAMQRLFHEGDLSIYPAVGSDDQTRSHFYAQDLMEHGGSEAGGWLGRFMRFREGESPGALSAIALGKVMPEVLRGAPAAAVIDSINRFSLSQRGESTSKIETELAELYGRDQTLMREVAKDTLQAIMRIQDLSNKDHQPHHGVQYAADSFSQSLRQTAQLIRAQVGLEAVSLDLNGWDSHFAQDALITPLMVRLSEGLSNFRRDLGHLMEKVTVVVMTEFGRRVAENSSFGTDHGRGGVMFALSEGGGGRVIGDRPELESGILVGPGDVPVQMDYRAALKPILSHHGAGESFAKIFPSWSLKHSSQEL